MKNKMLTALLVTAAVMLAACGSQQLTTSPPTTSPLTITEFPLAPEPSTSDHLPLGITAGPDGNLWFTECDHSLSAECGSKVGRITPKGQITEFPLPMVDSRPGGITAGPDGNLWFTDGCSFKTNTCIDNIGRITPTGQISEFPLPMLHQLAGSLTPGITAGPDGNLWFAEEHNIGRITPTGQITEFPLPPPDDFPSAITTGPDGNLWFTQRGGLDSIIGRITPKGQITQFLLHPQDSNEKNGITAGPDGNLWFTECGAPCSNGDIGKSKIWRITPSGSNDSIQASIQEFPLPHPLDYPYGITAGPDGNLWFTGCVLQGDPGSRQCATPYIGRITPKGQITEFPLNQFSNPYGITKGPDGNLWFAEADGQIGRITPEK